MKRRSRIITVSLAILWATYISGCSRTTKEGRGSTNSGFRLATLEGDTVSLSDLRGKVVLIDFWATWCAPCRAYIPYLIEFHKKYQNEGLVILGISADNGEALRSFKTAQGIPYQILQDPTGEISSQYGVVGIPTTIIYNRAGKTVKKVVGFNETKMAEEEEEIKELLKEK